MRALNREAYNLAADAKVNYAISSAETSGINYDRGSIVTLRSIATVVGLRIQDLERMPTEEIVRLRYIAKRMGDVAEYVENRIGTIEGDRAFVGEFPYEPEKLFETWLEDLHIIREKLTSIEPPELAKTVELTGEDINFLLDLIDDYYTQVKKAQIGTSISLSKLDEVQQKLETGRRRK